MCGIVGYIGNNNVMEIVLDGLAKLEYRGYDSAGIALIEDSRLYLKKSEGKLENLISLLRGKESHSKVGIGHTRWATHGIPSDFNAHPHVDCKEQLVVVHNGIIENYYELRQKLLKKGHRFTSETDTEVIVHLIEDLYENDLGFAVKMALHEVEGAYAIAVISVREPDRIVAARKGSPLIIGVGQGENYIASDVPAILNRTKKVIYLSDGEIAVVTSDSVEISTLRNTPVQYVVHDIEWDTESAEKGGFEHFMLKEIHEQASVLQNTMRGRIDYNSRTIDMSELNMAFSDIRAIEHINFVACGTAYHAGILGKYYMEEIAKIHSSCDVASEFRYRNLVINKESDFTVLISQSGETADTLAALRKVKDDGGKHLGIVNVVGSTIAREAADVLYTRAGIEIGVAATKTFVAQILATLMLAIYFGKVRGTVTEDEEKRLVEEITHLPQLVDKYLELESGNVEKVISGYTDVRSCLFLGRHYNYPIAQEGALKLKEISYIHAEGYPSGELKHGPIALIDEFVPTVALATDSFIYKKVVSNILEVRARKGRVIAIVTEGNTDLIKDVDAVLYVPKVSEEISPIMNSLCVQLISYYAAKIRGCNVDKPRNLAKSVTVE